MTDFLIGRDRSIRYGGSGTEEPQAPVKDIKDNPVEDNPQIPDTQVPDKEAPKKEDTLFDTEDKAVEPTLVAQDASSPSGGTDFKAEKEKPSNTKKTASTKKSPSKGTTSKTKK